MRHLVAIALIGALGFAWSANAQLPQDFATNSAEWNGLSRLQGIALEEGLVFNRRTTLDYSELSVDRPLLILFPSRELNVNALQNFLADGGRILLADEVGSATGELLDRVDIERVDERDPNATQREYRLNPNLPLLTTPGRHALLEGRVRSLVANHPVAYRSELPAVVYYDDPELGFAFDLTVGEGKMIVIGDASLFINLMLNVGDNRAFVVNSLRYVCAGRSPCEVDLYVGDFEGEGFYGELDTTHELVKSLEEGLEKLNEVANSLADMVPERPLLRAMTLLLAMGLAIFCLSIFPMRPPRFLSLSFRPAQRLLPRSEFERHLMEYARDGKRANYALPIAILRDEFERIFYREVYVEGSPPAVDTRYMAPMMAQTAERYGLAVGESDREIQDETRKAAELLKQLARVPVRSQLFIDLGTRWGERDLMQLYHQSAELLERLGVREEYEQRTGPPQRG